MAGFLKKFGRIFAVAPSPRPRRRTEKRSPLARRSRLLSGGFERLEDRQLLTAIVSTSTGVTPYNQLNPPSPVAIDSKIAVIDSANLTEATVTMFPTGTYTSGGYSQGYDVLALGKSNGSLVNVITLPDSTVYYASWSSATQINIGNAANPIWVTVGQLTVIPASGSATQAEMSAVLDGVQYENIATTTTTLSTAARTATFEVTDSALSGNIVWSSPATKQVSVTASPLVTTSSGTTAFVQAVPVVPVAVDTGLTVTSQSGSTLNGATIQITGGYVNTEDVLNYIAQQATISTAAGNGTAGYTGIFATSIAAGSNGVTLPASIINVASTTGFATSGTIYVATNAGVETLTYTGTTASSFTGCTGGEGTMSTGGAVAVPATAAELNGVQGVAVDSNNNIFIADTANNVIREVIAVPTPAQSTAGYVRGDIVTVAGNGTAGYLGSGSTTVAAPSNNAALNASTTVAANNGTLNQSTTIAAASNGATLYAGTTIAAGSNGTTLSAATTIGAASNGATLYGSTSVAAASNGATMFRATTIAAASNNATLNQSTTIAAASNNATLYASTSVAAASNNATMFKATTIAAASNTATLYASTTIALASNGKALPQTSITVASTTGFATSGTLSVTTSSGVQTVTYTGITATTFTGCSGGTGTMSTGGSVVLSSITVANTTGFATSGTITVVTSAGTQNVTYTGTTATQFTGCTGGTGTMSTGGAVTANSITVASTTGFATSGTISVVNSVGTAVTVTYTGITATTFTGCTGGAGTMVTGGAVTATSITVASTTGFATSGTISVTTSAGVQTVTYTGATTTTFTGCTGGTGTMTTGGAVVLSSITVASTANFATSGTIAVVTSAGVQTVTYTGTTATQFTGCTGGTGTMTTGGAVTANSITVASTAGFAAAGTISVVNSVGTAVTVTYTGITATTFTGCTGGAGTMVTGGVVTATSITVASTTGFATAGTLWVTTSAGLQAVTYTGDTATTFTGCSGGTGTMTTGGSVVASSIDVASTAGFATSGTIAVTTTSNGVQTVTYTGITATTFTGCSTGPTGTMATGGKVTANSITVASTTGFAASGTIVVTTSNGAQTVTYTGTTATTFTGCTGGVGTMTTGGAVTASSITVASTTGFATSGTLYVTTSAGPQTISYSGTTPTTFIGCTGGNGTLIVGNAVTPASITVASTVGFPTSGTILVTTSAGTQTVTYTGTTSTMFTGCTGGTGTMTTGGSVGEPPTAATAAELNKPSGLAVVAVFNGAGFVGDNIFIADTSNNVIREVPGSGALAGDIITVAGTGIAGGTTTVAAPSNNATLYATTTVAAADNGIALYANTTIAAASDGATLSSSTTIDPASNGATLAENTTIAAASNGATLYASTTVDPISNGATLNATTTIAAASNGVTLPTGTINVASTAGFATSGTLAVVTSAAAVQTVTYTGITATSFTGCTGGTGQMSSGGTVTARSITVASTANFATSGTIAVTTSTGTQTVTYTGITATTFTGCTGGTGNMSTGGAITAKSITVASTTGFATSGTIYVATSAGLQTVTYTGTTATTFTGCTGGTGTMTTGGQVAAGPTTAIAAASNGVALPQATITVTSTTGFASSGTLLVVTDAGVQTVTYTGITATTFTGCSGGTGNMSTGGAVVSASITITVASTTGFATSGTITVVTSAGVQTVYYTGTTATTFTGCSGGTGTMSTGGAVGATSITVASTAGFAATGTIAVSTSAGLQTVTYTGKTTTMFIGCSGGTGTMSLGGAITANSITVASTAGFATSGTIAVVTSAGIQTVTYTGTTSKTFTGCTGGTGTMATGNAVTANSITVLSTTGFATSGSILVTTSNGVQTVNYTGITGTTFTGCTGGTGTLNTGDAVAETATAVTGTNLDSPSGVAVDANGDVFIADTLNNVIRELIAVPTTAQTAAGLVAGDIATVAGTGAAGYSGNSGAATAANLNAPFGVAVDAYNGTILIADTGNNCIRAFTLGGSITLIAGNTTAGFAGDNGPATLAEISGPDGVAADANGNIYIADTVNNRVRRVDNVTNTITTFVGTGVAGYNGDGLKLSAAELYAPVGIALDAGGNPLIADTGNNRLRSTATITALPFNTLTGTLTLTGTASLAAYQTALRSVTYADTSNTPNTSTRTITFSVNDDSGTSLGATKLVSVSPILPTVQCSNGVTTYTVDDLPTPIDPATAGGSPGVQVTDGISATDTSVSIIGATVQITGGYVSTEDLLAYPNTVNTIGTIAGTGTAGNTGNGAQATAAEINTSEGVAVDSKGDVFIADTNSNCVREINASNGVISIVAGNGIAGYTGFGDTTVGAVSNNATLYAATTIAAASNNVKLNASTTIAAASNGKVLPQATITVASTAGFATAGTILVTTTAGVQTVTYTGITATTFTGCTGGRGTMSTGGTVAAGSATINVVSTAGFATAGTIAVTTSAGVQTLTYTGITATTFTGCSGGTGTLSTGGSVVANSISVASTLGFASSGTIFVTTDAGVQTVSYTGVTATTFIGCTGGTGTLSTGNAVTQAALLATAAELNKPGGVAVDSNGDLFIADTSNSVIREVIAVPTTAQANAGLVAGDIVTLVGTGAAGFSGDGGLATAAQLNAPYGLTLDSNGDIFIADTNNNRIREVLATGNQAGDIITVAGSSSTAGFSGDNGAATAAKLNKPHGVAVDAKGDIFIADTNNNRIREVGGPTSTSPQAGIIVTYAGNGNKAYGGDQGQAAQANLNVPDGVAVDINGNVYIADTGNNRIREVLASTGIISTIAGNGTAGFTGDGGAATTAELKAPQGLAVGSNFDVYIADTGNYRIRQVEGVLSLIATWNPTATYNGVAAGELTLSTPKGVIATYNDYNVALQSVTYQDTNTSPNTSPRTITFTVTDANGPSAPSTKVITFTLAAAPTITDDVGTETYVQTAPTTLVMPLDSPHETIVSDPSVVTAFNAGGLIYTAAGNGTPGYSGDGGLAVNAQIDEPAGVAVDTKGDIFIDDANNNVIREVIAATGKIVTVVGNGTAGYQGSGGAATAAELNSPQGIALDASGDLFIADTGNNVIWEVVYNGTNYATSTINVVAGNHIAGYRLSDDGGPATAAELNAPQGVAVDSSGDVFVADTNNNRIREFTVGGNITTVAGNGTKGYTGDYGLATAAELSAPQGVAVDNKGDIFIADTGNNAIREFTVNGQITTVAGNGIAGYKGDAGLATAAELFLPQGVAVDSSGDIFIADTGNSVIREVVYNGTSYVTSTIATVVGNGTAGYNGDGVALTEAELNNPGGIALDSNGNPVIADTLNDRVRCTTGTIVSDTTYSGMTVTTGDPLQLLTGATVTIAVNLDPNDQLTLRYSTATKAFYYVTSTRNATTGRITSTIWTTPIKPTGSKVTYSYNATTGVLTLSGLDTAGDYQAALEAVCFQNIIFRPSGLTRSINYQASDSGGPGNIDTILVNVTPIPALTIGTGASSALVYRQNQYLWTTATTLTGSTVTYSYEGPEQVAPNLAISEGAGIPVLAAQVTISAGYVNSTGQQDTLDMQCNASTYAYWFTPAGKGVTTNYSYNGLYYNPYHWAWNAGTGVLTLTGNPGAGLGDTTDDQAIYQAGLDSVFYQFAVDHPGNPNTSTAYPGSRTVSFQAADSTNQGAYVWSAAATRAINVAADTPTVTPFAGSLAYTAMDPWTPIDPFIKVAYGADTNDVHFDTYLTAATIQITANSSAGDALELADNSTGTTVFPTLGAGSYLVFADGAIITDELTEGGPSDYNPDTNKLTLYAVDANWNAALATKADWATALAEVGFYNISSDPGNATRTISYTVWADTYVPSAAATKTIMVFDSMTMTASVASPTLTYGQNLDLEATITGTSDNGAVTGVIDGLTFSTTGLAISSPGDVNFYVDQVDYDPTTGLPIIGPHSIPYSYAMSAFGNATTSGTTPAITSTQAVAEADYNFLPPPGGSFPYPNPPAMDSLLTIGTHTIIAEFDATLVSTPLLATVMTINTQVNANGTLSFNTVDKPIMTTAAGSGNGLSGFAGDGSVPNASSTYLSSPEGEAVDPTTGNLYIADTGNNRIREVSQDTVGVTTAVTYFINTVAGTGAYGFYGDGGTGTFAALAAPEGLAFWIVPTGFTSTYQPALYNGKLDDQFLPGNEYLFIADTGNNRIRALNVLTGTIFTVAGDGVNGSGGNGGLGINAAFHGPTSVAIAFGSDLLYITDTGNNCVRVLNLETGIISPFAGTGSRGFSGDGGAATSAYLSQPEGVAVDSSGDVFIADTYNDRVREVIAVPTAAQTAAGLVAGDITTIAGTGTYGFYGDGLSAVKAEFEYPVALAIDSNNDLYISDYYNERVRIVNLANGLISTYAGTGQVGYNPVAGSTTSPVDYGDGYQATDAPLFGPTALAIDTYPNALDPNQPAQNVQYDGLYIADSGNNAVREAVWPLTVKPATPTVTVTASSAAATSAPYTGATAVVSGVQLSYDKNTHSDTLEGTTAVLRYYAGNCTLQQALFLDEGGKLAGKAALGTTPPTAPGTYTVIAYYAGSNPSYNGLDLEDYTPAYSLTPAVFNITTTGTLLPVTIVVTDNGDVYNAQAFAATITVNGQSSLEGVTPTATYYVGSTATGTGSSTAPVLPGTYTVVGSFAGSTDYASGTSTAVTFTISSPTIVGSGHFNGSSAAADLLWRNEVPTSATYGEVGAWLISNGTITGGVVLATASPAAQWDLAGTGNFTGNGTSDILWVNTTTGTVGIWLISNAKVTGWSGLPYVPPSTWTCMGIGDFNGDGTSDVLWESTGGSVGAWLINNATVSSWDSLPYADPSQWNIIGVGSVNGTATSDVVWRNSNSGAIGAWILNDGTVTSWLAMGAASATNWNLLAIGNFNSGSSDDLLWQNTTSPGDPTGTYGAWVLQNSTSSWASLPYVDPTQWQYVAVDSVLGGSNQEVVWQNISTGLVGAWTIQNGTVVSWTTLGQG